MGAGRGNCQGSPPRDDPSIIGLPCKQQPQQQRRASKSRERNTLLSYVPSETGAAEVAAYSEGHMFIIPSGTGRDSNVFGGAHTDVVVGPSSSGVFIMVRVRGSPLSLARQP